jgi:hypothetical protein
MAPRLDRQLTALLGAWGAGSVVAGKVMSWKARPDDGAWQRGFARQQVGWGAVDLAIAGFGALRGRGDQSPPDLERLHRLLLINTAADVGYLAGGLILLTRSDQIAARLPRADAETVRGDGAGILVQGGFLLLLDAIYALRTRAPAQAVPAAVART